MVLIYPAFYWPCPSVVEAKPRKATRYSRRTPSSYRRTALTLDLSDKDRQVKVPVAVALVPLLALALLSGLVVGAILAVPDTLLISFLMDELMEIYPPLRDDAKEKSGPSSELIEPNEFDKDA